VQLDTYIKKISQKFSTIEREKKRLRRIPRYIGDSTKILQNRIDFVDSVSFLHGYQEIFEEECYSFNASSSYPFIIDCGSNIGLSIIYFKRQYPNARIIGFEPDPMIFRVLNNNIANFKLQNVELHNKAIWLSDGLMEFRQEGGFSGRKPLTIESSNTIVASTRLSPFINEKVDLLKIDIEGAEIDVLFEVENRLDRVERLFIEYHSPSNEVQRLDELLNLLKKNNFRYYIKEAFVSRNPFLRVESLDGMDLQLNIYGIRI
jgi:FkbM family methyltransferase